MSLAVMGRDLDGVFQEVPEAKASEDRCYRAPNDVTRSEETLPPPLRRKTSDHSKTPSLGGPEAST